MLDQFQIAPTDLTSSYDNAVSSSEAAVKAQ